MSGGVLSKNLNDEDRDQIFRWNAIVPSAVEDCVHDLIVNRMRASPTSSAVHAWDGDLMYDELDQLSSRLAQHLMRLGVGPEKVVPLCFEKSMWTVVAMLGTVKAGGAFVLLDPNGYPEARLRAITQQVGSQLVLTSHQNASLAARLGDKVVVVSRNEIEKLCNLNEPPNTGKPTRPSNALYVVFTSGSTGQPKGVVITHSNYLSGALRRGSMLGYSEETRAFDFGSYSFDASIERNLCTLLFGGCICIPSDTGRLDDIAGSINETKANLVGLTPSIARLLEHRSVSGIEMLNMGGELAASSDIRFWASRTRLINRYGPAECSVVSTVNNSINPDTDPRNIGRGVGAVLWVVDAANHDILLPIGDIGELLIEGPIVGRGYLDTAQNATSFIRDPEWLLAGAKGCPGRHGRLYKTGDLVQYNKDGTILYRGRKDTQVKIRGQRVELGEIENHLRRLLPPDTSLAAEVFTPATETGRGTGAPLLAAFLVAETTHEPSERALEGEELLNKGAAQSLAASISSLGEEMAKELPIYMVPTTFIPIFKMPMTVTGKLDRKRLRELGATMSAEQLSGLWSSREREMGPTTENERNLQQLWIKILPVTSIGREDNFFRAGGDSIAAMKLAEAARISGVSLSVTDMFRHPKLSDMALVMSPLHETDTVDGGPFSLLGDKASVVSVCTEAATQCGVETEQIEDVYPCTPLQEGLMALSLKRTGAYVVQRAMKMADMAEAKHIQSVWEKVVASGKIMRTRIIHTNRGLMQAVITESISWVVGDNLESYLRNDRQNPVQLGKPLTRYAIITSATGEVYLVWTAHHAVYDGWSWSLFTQRLDQARQGITLEPQVPYTRFIKYLQNIDQEVSKKFWRAALQGGGSIFPSLRSRIYEPQADGRTKREVRLEGTKGLDVTASTVIRAAWSILAARLSASSDGNVLFGVTLMGRNAPVPGIEEMEGPTIATVPLKVTVDPGMPVTEFLQAVQAQSVSMMPHEHLGLQTIRSLDDDARIACDFQTLLVTQPWSKSTMKQDLPDGDAANYDAHALTLQCWLNPDGMVLDAIFDTSVIPLIQMERVLGQFEHVLKQLWQMPKGLVGEIDCMNDEDKSQIWRWNETVPATAAVPALQTILQNVERYRDTLAMCAWDGELTYGQLDDLSSRIATELINNFHVESEVFVPVLFEKSMWTSVAILGVMKAGGAFVLLDAEQPQARLQTIVDQVGSKLILTSARNEQLGHKLAEKTMVVSRASVEMLPPALKTSWNRSSPDAAMYVVFTSGTTGKPKGVVISNANYASGVLHRGSLMFTDRPRLLNFASYSFDVGIEGTLCPLILGGCIYEPSNEIRYNDLAGFVNRHEINVINVTPSVARLLTPESLPKVNVLILGGEALTAADVTLWGGSRIKVLNAYGPSECTVTSHTKTDVTANTDPSNIGTSIGALSWIVDSHNYNKLLPIGAIGELLIEGPIVGRGYLRNPDQTSKSFIEDPTWLLQGMDDSSGRIIAGRRGRLYRTGDLVRYEADGSIIFVGRKDTQIKLRGQRIELGDVEHHVRGWLPTQTEVVAELITPDTGTGEPTLVAFITMPSSRITENGSIDVHCFVERERESLAAMVAGLKESLAEVVPRYLIPSAYIPIHRMPLMPSGKINRRQLQTLGLELLVSKKLASLTASTPKRRTPGTEKEKLLQSLWADILRMEPKEIGLDDSFFGVGGESISAMRLVGAARAKGFELTVGTIFRHATLSAMANIMMEPNPVNGSAGMIDTAKDVPFSLLEESVVEVVRAEIESTYQGTPYSGLIEDIYPCSYLQAGLMEVTVRTPGAFMIQSITDVSDATDAEQTQRAWERVVASSAILRTQIVRTKDLGLVQVVMSCNIQWEHATNLDEYLLQGQASHMLPGTPLSRHALVADAATGHLSIVWTVHHSLYDGWSLMLVQQRVQRERSGIRTPAPADYKNFIRHMLQKDQTPSRAYWEAVYNRPGFSTFPAFPSATYLPFPNTWAERDMALGRPKNPDITLPVVLRAALALLISRLTHSDDVVFQVILTGRDIPLNGIENLEGPTFVMLPLRVHVPLSVSSSSSSADPSSFLEQVHTQRITMIPHEHIGHLLRTLTPHTLASYAPKTALVIQPPDIRDGSKIIENPLSATNPMALCLFCSPSKDGREVGFRAFFDQKVIGEVEMEGFLRQLEGVVGLLWHGRE